MDIHHENVIPNSDIGIRFFESIVDTSGFLPFHWHSSIELVYVMNGRLDMQFNGKMHTIEANQLWQFLQALFTVSQIHLTKH